MAFLLKPSLFTIFIICVSLNAHLLKSKTYKEYVAIKKEQSDNFSEPHFSHASWSKTETKTETNWNKSSRIPKLTSSGTLRSCLTMNQTSLATILEQMEHSIINVVELKVSVQFKNTIQDFSNIKWANKIGREIITMTSYPPFFYDKFNTLNVGTIQCNLQLYGTTNECMHSVTNGTRFLIEFLLKKLYRSKHGKYELCHEEKAMQKTYRCCKLVDKQQIMTCYNHKISPYAKIIITYYNEKRLRMILAYWIVHLAFAFVLVIAPFISVTKRTYYTVTESPMSLWSIGFSLFVEGHGIMKALLKRLILVGFVTLFHDPRTCPDIIVGSILILWPILFQLFDRVPPERNRIEWIYTKCLQYCLHYEETDIFRKYNYNSFVTLFTLFFNVKFWCNRSERFGFFQSRIGNYTKCSYILVIIQSAAKKCFCFLFFILGGMVLLVTTVVYLLSAHCFFGYTPYFSRQRHIKKKVLIGVLIFLHFILSYIWIIFVAWKFCSNYPVFLLQFMAGLILNVVFFIPYITFISVIVFYCFVFWDSVESKYFLLKMQIFEVCKEKFPKENYDRFDGENEESTDRSSRNVVNSTVGAAGNSVNSNANRSSNGVISDSLLRIESEWGYSENDEPVISKKLYNRVREKILPYHLGLFIFFLKTFFIVLLAYFLFTLLDILQKTDISYAVKLLTTMATATLPYILNVVTRIMSPGRKKAEKETQKIQVEKYISELIEAAETGIGLL